MKLPLDVETSFPFYYVPRSDIFTFISDNNLALAAPVIAYWAYSLFFFALDCSSWSWIRRYQLHEPAEVVTRNRATVGEVIRAVILQQVIQTVLGYFWMEETAGQTNHGLAMANLSVTLAKVFSLFLGPRLATHILAQHGQAIVSWVYWWGLPSLQFFWAIFIIDTWEYFLHRYFHTNKYLYKKFHSVHHRLYVPYAFGALYNHWFEGLLLDTLGAAIAHSMSFMTVRQAIFLFTFSTMKTVDDHCGYALPFDPLQWLFPNNSKYHDVHHQAWGIKYNFSQPYYVHWDTILGTRHAGPAGRREKEKDT